MDNPHDPINDALEAVNTTYVVRVGPYAHKVDKRTGRHEVVSKEALTPQTFYLDKEGSYHVRGLNRPSGDLQHPPSK